MSWLDRFLDELKFGVPPDLALESLCAGLPPEDARALREERAAILEFDGGLSQVEAERRAGLEWASGHSLPREE